MGIYEYRGILVQTPVEAKYIGVNTDGMLKAFTNNPSANLDGSFDDAHALPLTVLNANKSLVDISLLKVFDPLVLNEIIPPGSRPFKKGDKYIIQSTIDEETCLNSEVHIVVSCYTPGKSPWTQVIYVQVNGLSIDNQLISNVVEVLHELHAV